MTTGKQWTRQQYLDGQTHNPHPTQFKYSSDCMDIHHCLAALNYWNHRITVCSDDDEAEHNYQLWRFKFNQLQKKDPSNP